MIARATKSVHLPIGTTCRWAGAGSLPEGCGLIGCTVVRSGTEDAAPGGGVGRGAGCSCLLYTSDAADE